MESKDELGLQEDVNLAFVALCNMVVTNHISRSISYDSNRYTNAAFRAKDRNSSYGFCMMKNNIPLVAVLIMGQSLFL